MVFLVTTFDVARLVACEEGRLTGRRLGGAAAFFALMTSVLKDAFVNGAAARKRLVTSTLRFFVLTLNRSSSQPVNNMMQANQTSILDFFTIFASSVRTNIARITGRDNGLRKDNNTWRVVPRRIMSIYLAFAREECIQATFRQRSSHEQREKRRLLLGF